MSRINFTPLLSEVNDPEPVLTVSERAREEAGDEMRRIMTEYLQPDNTLSLDKAIDSTAPLYRDGGSKVINFHMIVIDLAGKIPHNHLSNKQLAAYVAAFYKSDEWLAQSTYQTRASAQSNFWAEMGIYLYEEANTTPDLYVKDGEDPMIYANMHAFLAELAWPDSPFAFFWARGALDRAFQKDTSTHPGEVYDAQVIGAAQYVLRQALTIFAESFKTRKSDHKSPSQTAKSFLPWFKNQPQVRKPDFTWDRWQAWKRGFKDVVVDGICSQTCRSVAESAADLMALQEKFSNNLLDS